jgi:hypothetical protein
MPLVFPVVLLLILGAVTLASRSTSSFLAASKQSDAQAARQAAESGMNRVLSALSPFAKNSGDPYLSFLLASTWNGGTGWRRLIQLGQAPLEKKLRDCKIATKGPGGQTVPNDINALENLVSGVIGTANDGKRILRYRLANYEVQDVKLPTDCADFWTISGGTAQITIQGTVELNGKVIATNRFTRSVDLHMMPFPEGQPAFYSIRPGPPNSLWVKTKGSGMNALTSHVYRDVDRDASPVVLSSNIGLLRPQCPTDCTPTPTNGRTNNFPLTEDGSPADLPPLNQYQKQLDQLKKLGQPLPLPFIAGNPPPIVDVDVNFAKNNPRACIIPPNLPNSIPRDLIIVCHFSVDPNSLLGPPPPEDKPYQPTVGVIRVDTSEYRFRIFISGPLGLPSPNSFGRLPAGSKEPIFKVVFTHRVGSRDCSSTPTNFNQNDQALRPCWNRLQIFGLEAPPPAGPPQTFYIAASNPTDQSAGLNGLFLWLPQGRLEYGNPSYSYDPKLNLWKLQGKETAPDVMSSWWVNELDLSNVTSLKFIMPLYGNPEVMDTILDGGYTNASGIPVIDRRFPVYPVLPRIRSTF